MKPLASAPLTAARALARPRRAPRRSARSAAARGTATLGCSLLPALGACSSGNGSAGSTTTPSATAASSAGGVAGTSGPDSTIAPSDSVPSAEALSTVAPGDGYDRDGEGADGSDTSGACRQQNLGDGSESPEATDTAATDETAHE